MSDKGIGMERRAFISFALVSALLGAALSASPPAHSDNKRLNDGVVANVYTVQHQAGCTNDLRIDPRLQLAAEWHTKDLIGDRALNADIGSNGSTPGTGRRPPASGARSPRRWRSTRPWPSAGSN